MSFAAGGRISAGTGANLLGQNAQERNQEATCFVGNLEPECTEEIIWELFVQTGRVGASSSLSYVAGSKDGKGERETATDTAY